MHLPPFKKPSLNRSKNMRAIRSVGNKSTEIRLVSMLREYGVKGWRLHPRKILGNPDALIEREGVAIFVDGCFWHGCTRCGHIPRTNRAYWVAKITRNVRRDRTITRALRAMGYSVVRVRECQLRKYPTNCLNRILRILERRSHLMQSIGCRIPKRESAHP